jgi:hypothetical protein
MNQFVNPLPVFNPPMMFENHRKLFARYSAGMIDAVASWCKKEYWDSLAYWSKRGNFKNVKFEVEEFSTVRLLATISVFDEIVRFIEKYPFVWDSLSKQTRRLVANAYEFKTSFRN